MVEYGHGIACRRSILEGTGAGICLELEEYTIALEIAAKNNNLQSDGSVL